jgi:hypothetical protein
MGFLNKAVSALNGAVAAGKSVATDVASAAQKAGSVIVEAVNVPPTGPGAPTGAPPGTAPAEPAPAPGPAPWPPPPPASPVAPPGPAGTSPAPEPPVNPS